MTICEGFSAKERKALGKKNTAAAWAAVTAAVEAAAQSAEYRALPADDARAGANTERKRFLRIARGRALAAFMQQLEAAKTPAAKAAEAEKAAEKQARKDARFQEKQARKAAEERARAAAYDAAPKNARGLAREDYESGCRLAAMWSRCGEYGATDAQISYLAALAWEANAEQDFLGNERLTKAAASRWIEGIKSGRM